MNLISRETVQQIDKKLEEWGASIESLIEIAGFLAFDIISKNIICKKTSILVMLGPGNNGSDGLVIARYLKMTGHKVTIYRERVRHENLLIFAKNCGVREEKVQFANEFDFIIDAIFGFSMKPPIKNPYQTMFNILKEHKFIIAIDMPSSDELSVKYLITFVGPKTIKNCENVYITRSFFPRAIYDDGNDYMNHRKIV